jgi:hypothetical protein
MKKKRARLKPVSIRRKRKTRLYINSKLVAVKRIQKFDPRAAWKTYCVALTFVLSEGGELISKSSGELLPLTLTIGLNNQTPTRAH